MHQMKTEVVVIRLTKQERAELDAKKTKPILSDWLKELAFAAPDNPDNKNIEGKPAQRSNDFILYKMGLHGISQSIKALNAINFMANSRLIAFT